MRRDNDNSGPPRRRGSLRAAVGGTLLLAVAMAELAADIVVLHNGNRIHGEVLKEGPREIALKFSGGIIQLPRKQIARIERESRVDYLIELSETQIGRRSFEDALATLEEAQREAPTSDRVHRSVVEARFGLATSLVDLERFGEARELFGRVLEDEPGHLAAEDGIEKIDSLLARAARDERQAIQELRRGNLESAVEKLTRLHEHFPERRKALAPVLAKALAGRGNALLSKGRWEAAEERYRTALEVDPEVAPLVTHPYTAIKQHQAEKAAREGDFSEVAEVAAAGLEIAPAHNGLRFYSALALESQGRKREAAESYLSIAGVRRPARLEESVGELRRAAEEALVEAGKVNPAAHPKAREATGKFRKLRSRHFEVVHRNNVVAREIAQVAEQDYTRLFRLLRCPTELRNRIHMMIYPTKEEYLRESGMASWSGGAHQVLRARGSLSEHRITCYQDQPRLLSGILTHEIAHALLAHRVNNKRLPLWANEGFAVHSEPEHVHRHHTKIVKKERTRRTLLPLKDLLASKRYPEENVQLYYAQSFSVVEFLIEQKGVKRFIDFLLGLGDDNLSGMLRRHYKIAGVNALENRWIGWLEHSR